MGTLTSPDAPQTTALLLRAAAGDAGAWGALLMEHEPRLLRMADFRLDPRLRGRVDASDVVQEAYLAAADQRQDYFRRPQLHLFLWLRGIVANKLLEVHRHHLSAAMRDAAREVAGNGRSADETSAALIDRLSADAPGPGTVACHAEVNLRLHQALDSMDTAEREVLVLRHFEQLTGAEAAAVLGINERAAAKRYIRALQRLRFILSAIDATAAECRP